MSERSLSRREYAEREAAQWREKLEQQLLGLRNEIARIDRQLAILKEQRSKLASERTRTAKILSNGRTFEPRGGGDAYYVACKTVGVYVRKWHEDTGYSYVRLGEIAGVSGQTLSRIERNTRRFVPLSTVDRILTAMGIPGVLNTLELIPFREISKTPEPPPSQYYEE